MQAGDKVILGCSMSVGNPYTFENVRISGGTEVTLVKQYPHIHRGWLVEVEQTVHGYNGVWLGIIDTEYLEAVKS